MTCRISQASLGRMVKASRVGRRGRLTLVLSSVPLALSSVSSETAVRVIDDLERDLGETRLPGTQTNGDLGDRGMQRETSWRHRHTGGETLSLKDNSWRQFEDEWKCEMSWASVVEVEVTIASRAGRVL